jgi:hypothetical protein
MRGGGWSGGVGEGGGVSTHCGSRQLAFRNKSLSLETPSLEPKVEPPPVAEVFLTGKVLPSFETLG